MGDITIQIKKNESILECFQRLCDDNGYNVSKLITYLDYFNEYVQQKSKENNNSLSFEIAQEVMDFGTYFLENYGEETKEKRFLHYGMKDALILDMYFTLLQEISNMEINETYESFTPLEQRKIDRVVSQLLNIDGILTFSVFDEICIDENSEPLTFQYSKDFQKDVKSTIEDCLSAILITMYDTTGYLLCIIENPTTGKTSEFREKNPTFSIFSLRFENKEIYTLNPKKLLRQVVENDAMVEEIKQFEEVYDELAFIDGSLYINPIGEPQIHYNNLGKKLPNRKRDFEQMKNKSNIVSFSKVQKNRDKNN